MTLHGENRDTVVDLVTDAVAAVPADRVAVRHPGGTLDYGTLRVRADDLAARLVAAGVRPGDTVAIRGTRLDTVVGMLAVWRTGGVYLALDPKAPAARAAAVLADARAALVVDGTGAGLPAERAPLPTGLPADRIAYLVYTSGTTGIPKGVVVAHTALATHLAAITERFGIGADDVVLHLAGPAVDVAVEQVLCALTTGATLVLPERTLLSADELLDLVDAERITVANLPAGYFHDLVAGLRAERARPASLRTVISGSDRLSPAAAATWLCRTGIRLVNAYGPTETVITAVTHEVAGSTDVTGAGVPIGTPVGSRTAHVLDGLTPTEGGELYLGGAALAAGYHDRPGLTAARFVPDPFAALPGARMYRTGDLVRRTTGDALEFVGRTDDQVKIRGFRVEPGEVRAALATHPAITTCAVVEQDGRLAAYVTGTAVPDYPRLREFLAETLPEHMIPSTVTVLEALPLTLAGKLDRAALPAPDTEHATAPPDAPRTQAEQLVAGIWADVLGVPGVGRGDNFFHLGGDSLTAVRVAGRVFDVFGAVSPYLIFDAPTLGEFAAALRDQLAGTPADRPGPVRRADRAAPLSRFQGGLWLAEQWQPGTATYNVPWLITFTGDLDADRLGAALRAVIDRHGALRTTFDTVGTGGRPVPRQVVHDRIDLPLSVTDLTADPQRFDEVVHADAQRPFTLADGPLVRARLVRTGPDVVTLVLVLHHLVWDEGSLRVLDRDLRECYAALGEGRAPRLPELAVQYGDYARWLAAEPVPAAKLRYWAGQLADAPVEPAIPPDHQVAERTRRGGFHRFTLEPELARGVRALARATDATPFMVLLAGLVAAHRRRGVDDLVIGTPVSVRDRPELDELIGYFINLVPLRFHLDAGGTARDLLDHVRDVALDGYRNQDVPFEDIVAAAREGSGEQHPLFQLVFEMHTADARPAPFDGVEVTRRLHVNALSRFDLSWSVEDDGTGFTGRVEFDADLFDPATLAELSACWQDALAAMVAGPDALVDESLPPRPDEPVHVRFAEQVARTPEAVAVIDGETRLRYAELDARANRVARHLIALGVRPGDVVAVEVARGIDLVVGLFGALKAGAGYTLLDPELPTARRAAVLADADVRLVVSRDTVEAALTAVADDSDPAVRVTADTVACVMFTSGSTGRPKGVAATHRALTNTYFGQRYAGFGPDEVWLQCSPVSWDAFGLELYGALLFGGVCVLQAGQRPDPQTMADLVARHGVTRLQLSASLFNLLVDEFPAIFAGPRVVFTGGERASVAHVARLAERYPHVRVVNGYGPVESMGFTTTHDVTPADLTSAAIPIGHAVAHKGIRVLDEKLRPVTGGDGGEIWATGAGLALGYVGRPGLTAGRFLPDPAGAPGERMYRTGDIGHWNPDGTLAITGRADDQAKIRGFRVEPGEVAAALATCRGVTDCAVVIDTSTGEARLAAYVTSRDGSAPDFAAVHDHLAGLLPDYMLPTTVTVLTTLPLTANGKLDRAALPAPPAPVADPGTDRPGTDAERLVAAVWADVLGVTDIGVHDNFFRLGGNSLAAVQVALRLTEATGTKVPPRLVFAARTPGALARKLSVS